MRGGSNTKGPFGTRLTKCHPVTFNLKSTGHEPPYTQWTCSLAEYTGPHGKRGRDGVSQQTQNSTHRGLVVPQHIPQRITCDASLLFTSDGQCLPLMAKSSLTMNLLLVHINKTANIAKFCSQTHEDHRNAEEETPSPNKSSLPRFGHCTRTHPQ